MAKARNLQVPQTVRDGDNDGRVTFDFGRQVIVVQLFADDGAEVRIDRPFSDFTDLTAPQKAALRAALKTIRDQAMILEGFS